MENDTNHEPAAASGSAQPQADGEKPLAPPAPDALQSGAPPSEAPSAETAASRPPAPRRRVEPLAALKSQTAAFAAWWGSRRGPLAGPRLWIPAALGYLLIALLLYLPALGSSRFVYGTDTFSHDYIMQLYGWNSVFNDGLIPLWCPYLFLGLPFVGSFAFCPFYPTQALFVLLPHNTAFTMQYALAVALAGLLTAVWVRQIGLSVGAALWAGAAFALSGHFLTLTYAGHLQKMIAIAWAPGAFAAMLVLCRRCAAPPPVLKQVGEVAPGGTARFVLRPRGQADSGVLAPTLGLGFCLAMQLLASHAQVCYATAVCCVLYGLAVAAPLALRAWVSPDPGLAAMLRSAPMRTLGRLVASVALALALAAAVSAVQMFPGFETGRISNRAAGVSFDEATETSYPPVELAEYAVPSFLGDSVRGSQSGYWGHWGKERIVSDFLGMPILLLALIGVGARFSRYRYFLALLAVGAIVVGLGRNTPVYGLLYAFVPGFSSFRSPGSFMFVADLALVGLAAIGLQAVVSCAWPGEGGVGARMLGGGRRETALHALLTALAAAAFALAVVGISRNWGMRLDIATPDEARRYHVNLGLIRLGWHTAVAAVLMRLLLVLGAGRGPDKPGEAQGAMRLSPLARAATALPRGSAQAAAVTLAAFCLLLLVSHNRHFIQFEPLDRYLEFLRFQPVYAALSGEHSTPMRLLEEKDLKNDHILHHVGTPTGYHPIVLGRYERIAQALGYSTEQFGNLFAIRFAHSWSEKPFAGLWQPVRQTPRETVWRWAGTERPWLHAGANVVEADNEAEIEKRLRASAGAAGASTFMVARTVLAGSGAKAGRQRTAGELISWAPGNIKLKAGSDGSALLPLAEFYAPGWKARFDDGTPIASIPVNIAMRALVLPGGAPSQVELRYAPASFRLGAFASLLTLAAVALVLAARSHTRLRRFVAARFVMRGPTRG